MRDAFKAFVVRGLLTVALLAVALPVFAANTGAAEKPLSEALSQKLYCDTGGLLQGNIGLIIGLVMVFLGIWTMVQGGKFMAALPLIAMGAIITALPSIAEASFVGLGNLLKAANISAAGFDAPKCGADVTKPTQAQLDKLYQSSPGVYYPSRGDYKSYQDTCGPTAAAGGGC